MELQGFTRATEDPMTHMRQYPSSGLWGYIASSFLYV